VRRHRRTEAIRKRAQVALLPEVTHDFYPRSLRRRSPAKSLTKALHMKDMKTVKDMKKSFSS